MNGQVSFGVCLSRVLCSAVLLAASLPGCSRVPESGPVELRWDRATCDYCRMVISAKGYAAQIRRDSRQEVFKFDDIGCAIKWMEAQGSDGAAAEIWVGDYRHQNHVHWLDARAAHYVPGQTTPMDYGYGATDVPSEDSMDFTVARGEILHRDEAR